MTKPTKTKTKTSGKAADTKTGKKAKNPVATVLDHPRDPDLMQLAARANKAAIGRVIPALLDHTWYVVVGTNTQAAQMIRAHEANIAASRDYFSKNLPGINVEEDYIVFRGPNGNLFVAKTDAATNVFQERGWTTQQVSVQDSEDKVDLWTPNQNDFGLLHAPLLTDAELPAMFGPVVTNGYGGQVIVAEAVVSDKVSNKVLYPEAHQLYPESQLDAYSEEHIVIIGVPHVKGFEEVKVPEGLVVDLNDMLKLCSGIITYFREVMALSAYNLKAN